MEVGLEGGVDLGGAALGGAFRDREELHGHEGRLAGMVKPLRWHHGVVPVENSLSGLRIDVTCFLRRWCLGRRYHPCALSRADTRGIQAVADEPQGDRRAKPADDESSIHGSS